MARFCLITGVAPSEYEQLNQHQIRAFIKTANEQNKKQ